jgi:bifunctional DNA-binding transcriptional regulator/antitoxin component of YhaV-PrlF toxin-antitoxin module
MPPSSEYTEKLPSPFSVRLSKKAIVGLKKIRRTSGLSEGDMIEWLIRETNPIKVVKRNRPGDLTERVSFRVTESGDTILRTLMKTESASGGDIVEAYILRAVESS